MEIAVSEATVPVGATERANDGLTRGSGLLSGTT
jgi:hypothetical protein